jgi:uncharacterized protein (DUF2236 family)
VSTDVIADLSAVTDDDLGLFGPGTVTWGVHADPAMLIGGLRALLLQTCHPVVMAGCAANSIDQHEFRGRSWAGPAAAASSSRPTGPDRRQNSPVLASALSMPDLPGGRR